MLDWLLSLRKRKMPQDDKAAWLKKIIAQIPAKSRVAIVASGGMGRETLRDWLREQGVWADSFGSRELANPADFDLLILGNTSDPSMQALTPTNLQGLGVLEFVVLPRH